MLPFQLSLLKFPTDLLENGGVYCEGGGNRPRMGIKHEILPFVIFLNYSVDNLIPKSDNGITNWNKSLYLYPEKTCELRLI